MMNVYSPTIKQTKKIGWIEMGWDAAICFFFFLLTACQQDSSSILFLIKKLLV